jgi:transposase
MMPTKRSAFTQKGFDAKEYAQYYHQNQINYIRIRLRYVKFFSEDNDFDAVAQKLGIGERLVLKSINLYLSGGFQAVVTRCKRKQPKLLTPDQEASFKKTILSSKPSEHGYSSNFWTGHVMTIYIKDTYNMVYKSGVYDLLARLKLSHQRAHADYYNANKKEQVAF